MIKSRRPIAEILPAYHLSLTEFLKQRRRAENTIIGLETAEA
jgi:hypothetical protein